MESWEGWEGHVLPLIQIKYDIVCVLLSWTLNCYQTPTSASVDT